MGKRGRKPEVGEVPPEVAEAREHGRQRTLYRAGNSWVVPVPLWARVLVDRRTGGSVYWHEWRGGEVILSGEPKRPAGRPHGAALQGQIVRLTRENTRLRRRLRARPLAAQTEEIWQVMMKALPVALPIMATAEETRDLVREILARIPWRGRTPSPPRRRAAVTVPGPDAYPLPEAPASGEQETAPVLDAVLVSEEKKEGAGGLVPDPLAARAGPEGSDSPPRAEE